MRQISIYVTPNTAAPQITRFIVDPPAEAAKGQAIIISWTVEGEVSNVKLLRSDYPLWEGAPRSGSFQDIPPALGLAQYKLVVTGPGGENQAVHNVNVVDTPVATATPQPDTPVIHAFSVQPAQINTGQCARIEWATGGATATVDIKRNNDTILDNARHSGSAQDCPDAPGAYTYQIVAASSSGKTATKEVVINVAP